MNDITTSVGTFFVRDEMRRLLNESLDRAEKAEAADDFQTAQDGYRESARFARELAARSDTTEKKESLEKQAKHFESKIQDLKDRNFGPLSEKGDEKINLEHLIVDTSGYSIKDIHGLDSILEDLFFNICYAMVQKPGDWKKSNGKNIIYAGDHGTGKTSLIATAAQELGIRLINIPLGYILSSWFGETSRKIHQIFEDARKMSKEAPVIIALDEIEALAGRSQDPVGAEVRIISTLRTEIDGFLKSKEGQMFTLATANMVNILDPFLLDRFRVIHVPMPSEETIKKILGDYLRFFTLDFDLSDAAKMLAGESGRQAAFFADSMISNMLRRDNPSLASLNGNRAKDLRGYQIKFSTITKDDMKAAFVALMESNSAKEGRYIQKGGGSIC